MTRSSRSQATSPPTMADVYFRNLHSAPTTIRAIAIAGLSQWVHGQVSQGIGTDPSNPIQVTAINNDIDDDTTTRFKQWILEQNYTTPRQTWPSDRTSHPTTALDFFEAIAKDKEYWIPQDPTTKLPFNESEIDAIELISHAQVHVFSTRYYFPHPKDLALQKLMMALDSRGEDSDLTPVSKLAAYTYAYAPENEYGDSLLRRLAVEHVLNRLERFRGDRPQKLCFVVSNSVTHEGHDDTADDCVIMENRDGR